MKALHRSFKKVKESDMIIIDSIPLYKTDEVGPMSNCCNTPIYKTNESGEGRYYKYTRMCSKCKKPTEVHEE